MARKRKRSPAAKTKTGLPGLPWQARIVLAIATAVVALILIWRRCIY
jgi:hypothetical protein